MTLNVPDDAPRYRFMRYVRPPAAQHQNPGPLFPIQPNTRKMRVGIDVQTLDQPTQELMRILGRDEEVEPVLLVQNDTAEPTKWTSVLGHRWYTFTFTTVEEAPKSADASTVGVAGYEDGELQMGTSAHFFSVYAQLDQAAREAFSDDSGLTLGDRHRAAALACAAGAVGVDVIVTAAPTAGREDVADNDIVLSISPDQLRPLFGHYLRVTGNHVLEQTKGRLQGGGTSTRTHAASSVSDLYLAGIQASIPHLTAIQVMSLGAGDQSLAQSMEAIAVRLSRAARAIDNLLAVLSNGSATDMQRTDTAEMTAEAFERVLLYLCAAMDRYARVTQTLFDTSLDPDKQRGSLTSTVELRSVIAKFEPTDTQELESLGSYAHVIGKLRNRIHALPLDTQHQQSRGYGSSTTVAVILSDLEEFDPAKTTLSQEQLDRLGVWNAESANPFEGRTYAADIATLATTLFREALRFLEEFSHFIIRNKTVASIETTQHKVLGCLADEPRPMPGSLPNEVLYRDLLGWADFG